MTNFLEDLRQHAKHWTQPITTEAPTGVSPTGQPAFDKVEAMVARLDSVSGAKVDWTEILTHGTEVLRTASKDIRVAAWVGVALYYTEGLKGLATGFTLMAELINDYWETLHPPLKRERARYNALSFLIDKAVQRELPETVTLEEAQRLEAALNHFLEAIRSHEVPWDRSIQEVLQAWFDAEVRGRAIAGGAARRVSSASEQMEQIQSEVRELCTTLAGHAHRVRTLDRSNAEGFRVLRAAAWLPLARVPQGPEAGSINMPSPTQQIRRTLSELESTNRFSELLEESELALLSYPLWLDLQYYTSSALSHLGPEYAQALWHVNNETRSLVRRLPALVRLAYPDGLLLAGPLTQRWIETLQ